MAPRQIATSPGARQRRAWLVAASLVVLFAAALFLRAYWNMDAAHDDGSFVLSGGSDPYYHKRAIDHIQANGFRTLLEDPLLNYPFGAVNPNPPLYEWSVAVAGQFMAPLFDGDVATSTWWATLWAPAVFGALTLIPIYFIGAALFDRRAGLVAALLWTISTSAIDTTGLGEADHDAAVMFFASLAFLFYIKTIQAFKGETLWVTRWRDGSSVTAGLGRLFRERREGFAYSLLTGVSIAAVALIWKGFPYVLGILFIYAGLQMVIDHWRNRDSTGIFLGTLVAFLVGTVLAVPYYSVAGVANFLNPVWYIIGAFAVGGLVLVPTRDLPTILVMPAALVVAALAAVVAFFVVPDVARSLLYATVYFKQTALYETIAEAHPADFSTIVFGIGPVPFFLALAGWFTLLFSVRRHPTRAVMFALVWGAVALFMAQSAVRFLFNAIPAFVVLAGFMTSWILDWLDFSTVRKSLAANQGNAWAGLRKGVRPMQATAVVLALLLFVMPNTMLAADAALPPEAESRIADESDSEFVKNFMSKRMGAYGQGYLPEYWRDGLAWLDQHDAHIEDPADRPAFLSWWDYGHWAIAVGRHPAVADNFQNGYEFAANFILAQNETQAVQLLAARLGALDEQKLVDALGQVGAADPEGAAEKLLKWEFVEDLPLAQSVDLVVALEQSTGKKIRYFATDVRMLPYDDPQTPSIEQSSIFYAPVRLKGENPDDYVATKINIGRMDVQSRSDWVTTERYEEIASDPIRQTIPAGERLEYQQTFFNSMYWRAYAGAPVQVNPGQPTLGDAVLNGLNTLQPAGGLQHFRLVYSSDALKIVEFTPGAVVEGTVTEEGTPLAGVTVTAYDDAGRLLHEGLSDAAKEVYAAEDLHVAHASTTTGDDGSYRVVAPFALEGGNVTIVASRDGVELGRAQVDITREDAESRAVFRGVDVSLQHGNVEGLVFVDADGDGRFNETSEQPAGNVTVTVGDKTATTGEDGRYRVDGVSSGFQDVTVESDTYQVVPASSRVRVQPGETATHDVGLEPKSATVTGTLWYDANDDGVRGENEALSFQTLTFETDDSVEGNTAAPTQALTQDGGAFERALRPGTYVVRATFDDPATDGPAWTLEEQLVVAPGETVERDFRMTQSEA